jgi:hypothetical protein
VIYTIVAIVAFFCLGVYCGFRFCAWAVIESIRSGWMQELIDEYEDVFGKPEAE